MVWQYINFYTCYIKKGLLLTIIRTRGLVENQMMCCCQSQIAIDYMKFCINPLWLVYVPAPLLPPPPPPAPPLLSHTLRLSLPVSILTRGTQGCPKTISLDKIFGIHLFWKSFQTSFFLPLCVRALFATPSAKNALLFSTVQWPKNLFRIFPCYNFFHPLPNECQLFMPKDFWDLPV